MDFIFKPFQELGFYLMLATWQNFYEQKPFEVLVWLSQL